MGQYNEQRLVENVQYPDVWTAVYSQVTAHVRPSAHLPLP